jgi:hypothetical protein
VLAARGYPDECSRQLHHALIMSEPERLCRFLTSRCPRRELLRTTGVRCAENFRDHDTELIYIGPVDDFARTAIDGNALDDVLEFAHVSRPCITLEAGQQ